MENIQWQSIHCTDLNCIYGAFIVTLSDTLEFCSASDHHQAKPSVDINNGIGQTIKQVWCLQGRFLEMGKLAEEECEKAGKTGLWFGSW